MKKNKLFTSTLNFNKKNYYAFSYDEPYIKDHLVNNKQIILGVTYLSLLLDYLKNTISNNFLLQINSILFIEPVILTKNQSVIFDCQLDEADEKQQFSIRCNKESTVKEICKGNLSYIYNLSYPSNQIGEIQDFLKESTKNYSSQNIYDHLAELGVKYGSSLHTLKEIYIKENRILGKIQLTDELIKKYPSSYINSGFFDGSIACGVGYYASTKSKPYIPLQLRSIKIYQPITTSCYFFCNLLKINDEVIIMSIQYYDEEGKILAELGEVVCKQVKDEGSYHSTSFIKQTLSSNQDKLLESTSLNHMNTTLHSIIIQLKSWMAQLLLCEVNKISDQQNFMELGLDSSTLIEFSNLISKNLKIELPPTIFFEYQNISELAAYFYAQHAILFNDNKSIKPDIIDYRQFVDKDTPVKRKTIAIHDTKDIAIIGMAGIFPGSPNLEEFWENLLNGKDLITTVPADRWKWEQFFPTNFPDEVNTSYSKWGGFIKEIDKFDAAFFNISPREAELMDPKQRIFLEVVWKVIEDAGYAASQLRGSKTGLFVGLGALEYGGFNYDKTPIEAYSATGIANSILPNRISYLLNLHGPSEPIDTACSSSLVAIHKAIQSIYLGECEQAIAGGINLMLSPFLHIAFCKAGMLSKSGKCKTFDKSADGYVRGEGAGAVLLKPLNKAIEDNDHIYGVIKGSAVNHGGYSNSLTAPNPKMQTELLIDTYKKANISPETISYIEVHGTGTELGDPIEVKALKNAFSHLKKANLNNNSKYCGLGSVKTNIGHLEAAAGIAGLIKVLLGFRHSMLPASLHFNELNPYINLDDSNFYIVDKATPWEPISFLNNQTSPKRAGVSSFGFGGVNAHVVLEEYIPSPSQENISDTPKIFILSAKDQRTLKQKANDMLKYLKSNPID